MLKRRSLQNFFSSPYLRNVGWLGSAELVNRILRLGTTVTLARSFSQEDYGLMAVIYTLLDFATVFTLRGGIGAKIIQAEASEVGGICQTAYWLNWLLCGVVFLVQCLIAVPIAQFYQNDQLILPICVAALTYLMLPLYLVHSALIERENRLKITALCNAAQSLASNTLTIILVIFGMKIWAIVWAMVLTTPIWIVITWRYQAWRPSSQPTFDRWREIVRFGGNLLGVQFLNKVQGNLDYLIIGRFLGLDALGIYYFAFNAGLGISMNVINTFMSALFPYICQVRQDYQAFRQRYQSSLRKIALTVVPLILLQALLAPIYVPIVFGARWIEAIPILILICLSVIPRIFSWAASLLLNAIDRPQVSLYLELMFTIIFTISLLISVPWGITGVAATVLIVHALVLPIIASWSQRYAFDQRFYP
ncbi:MAG: lipopolysaccharide biosynthesis protein [Elainella sp. Prado103]|jgi:PST family polysaccharide transporter|nr:lipopolysaccharide biosynthesis protein [Elainella sp. Prado103]